MGFMHIEGSLGHSFHMPPIGTLEFCEYVLISRKKSSTIMKDFFITHFKDKSIVLYWEISGSVYRCPISIDD
jgi:hypothetical protein